MDKTTWNPERKIVGGAIALIIAGLVQVIFPAIEMPIGMEGAIAILAAYFIPNKAI